MELWDDQGSPTVTAVFEVPGLRPEEVTVEVVDGSLVVSGERRPRRFEGSAASSDSPEETNSLSSGRTNAQQVRELKYGIFRRAVVLPSGCIVSEKMCTPTREIGADTIFVFDCRRRTWMPRWNMACSPCHGLVIPYNRSSETFGRSRRKESGSLAILLPTMSLLRCVLLGGIRPDLCSLSYPMYAGVGSFHAYTYAVMCLSSIVCVIFT